MGNYVALPIPLRCPFLGNTNREYLSILRQLGLPNSIQGCSSIWSCPGWFTWSTRFTNLIGPYVFIHARFWDFTFYSPNFVYWVGFVTGITFTPHLWNVDFIYLLTFWKNRPSSLGCYFWEENIFFKLVIYLCFRPNPYTRMCVSTIGSF